MPSLSVYATDTFLYGMAGQIDLGLRCLYNAINTFLYGMAGQADLVLRCLYRR